MATPFYFVEVNSLPGWRAYNQDENMKSYLMVGLLSFLTLACTETVEEFQLTGSMQGKIVLYDEAYNVIEDYEGVTILAEGASGNQTAEIDLSTGLYTIDNLNTGIYFLNITGPGYGTNRMHTSFIGGGISYNDFQLVQKSKLSMESLKLTDQGANTLFEFKGTAETELRNNVSNTVANRSISIFVSKSPDLSKDNFGHRFTSSVPGLENVNHGTTISNLLFTSTFGYKPGDKVYLVAMGGSFFAGYYDPEKRVTVSNGLNDQVTPAIEYIVK